MHTLVPIVLAVFLCFFLLLAGIASLLLITAMRAFVQHGMSSIRRRNTRRHDSWRTVDAAWYQVDHQVHPPLPD